ncbi:MAG: DHHA1 domain-containing protein [Nanoarchaeota archaeon]
MLTSKQINELKEHLERSQNPLFLYDNDADGLCSYVLLRRWLGRGKGVAVRSYPGLDAGYAKRAVEFGADAVFVLDKPVLSEAFLNELDLLNLPCICIDHHDVEQNYGKKSKNFFMYNPSKNKGKNKSFEPVTFLAYALTQKKEDIWIALMGCIADHHLPSFAKEFSEQYPELWGAVKEPFDAYYRTELGKIAQALGFGLKDSISHVVALQNFLIACKHPSDVFSEEQRSWIHGETYKIIKERYDRLIMEAEKEVSENIIFFTYAGETSMSASIANYLCYHYPKRVVAVAYMKGEISNISLRGKGIRTILEKVLKKFPEASGGGHADAVGARVKTNELAHFREALEKEII